MRNPVVRAVGKRKWSECCIYIWFLRGRDWDYDIMNNFEMNWNWEQCYYELYKRMKWWKEIFTNGNGIHEISLVFIAVSCLKEYI